MEENKEMIETTELAAVDQSKTKGKSKGNKAVLFIVLGIIIVLGVGIGLFLLKGKNMQTNGEENIVLKEGQSLVYGEITAINGNEMTYRITNNPQSSDFEKGERPEGFERGERPEGFEPGRMLEGFEPGQMPEGFEPGQMPEGFEPGRMPEGFEPGRMPEGFEPGQMPEGFRGGQRPGGFGKNREVTVQIPVGTKVTTALGAETTFSRLETGDSIRMLVEKGEASETILEIWILE
ncbi:MAG: hypothetical protein IKW28_00785 [Lachnospiraceae bacterium]|nr:hypothetical protein [Lachnospiraceae bacterium]